MEAYRVLLETAVGEIVEKKSRFIATLKPCETEEEALLFIEEMKKNYWDARHNCYAYCIGDQAQLMRFSDDGEPTGTAGKPMLEVLLNSQVRNIAVVVTRYFGGVLLGTGGLVRAYTQAVQEALGNAQIGLKCLGTRLHVKTDYNKVGKLLYLFGQKQIEPEEKIYTEDVEFTLVVQKSDVDALMKEMVDLTGGTVEIQKLDDVYFIDK